MIRRGIMIAALALGLSGAAAVPALARSLPPPVYTVIDGAHGTLTTPSPLHVGQVLRFFGYFTGSATVTSIRAAGPVDVITLSPGLPASLHNLVLDAH